MPAAALPQQATPTQAVRSGGCLAKRWRRWRQLSFTAGRWTREGVRLPWLRRPKTRTLKQKDLSPQEEAFLDEEVKRMLDQQAIFVNKAKNLVLSSIYTVPKKDGKRRPVINLRWVNKHLRKIKFKMSTIKDVKAAITQGCYMTTLDLKDCFWGFPVHKDDQRFLS